MTSSLTALWGLPGGQDLADYNVENGNVNSLPKYDSGFDRSWEESLFLNMGLEYKPTEKLTLRFDAYNIMGWIDKDYNKINEFQRTDHYQNQAAAFGLTLRYKF